MLRACRRVLRPEGRIAFYTIFATPGLTGAAKRCARAGGPFAMALRSDYPTMMRTAGFEDICEIDASDAFVQTARRSLELWVRHEGDLASVYTREEIDQGRTDREACLLAAERGYLRRALFCGMRRGDKA